MFKSLLIFLFLFVWFNIASFSSCLVFIIYITVFTTLLTIALSEINILKRYAIAETIFHKNTSLFSLVKSVWLTLFISLILSFVASIIVLVVSTVITQIVACFITGPQKKAPCKVSLQIAP